METKQIYTVQTSHGPLKYWRDWDESGAIKMENPRTIERYNELMGQHPDPKPHGVFFAFSDEQFLEGYNDLVARGVINDGDKIVSAGAGAYGTHKGLDAFFNEYKKRDATMAAECDPQEVYFFEYNNHECMFGYDGDADAMEVVKRIYGDAIVDTIHRVGFNAYGPNNDEQAAEPSTTPSTDEPSTNENDENHAAYILAALKANHPVFMSWGVTDITTIPNGVRFHVNGYKMVGHVAVVYNEGLDAYELTFTPQGEPTEHYTDVFVGELAHVIDERVEHTDDYEQRVNNDPNVKMVKAAERGGHIVILPNGTIINNTDDGNTNV